MKSLQNAEFSFSCGALPLDLAATLRTTPDGGPDADALTPPGTPARWLHAAGLTPSVPPMTEVHVQALLTLRRVIRVLAGVMLKAAALPPMEVASLNAQAAMPLAIPQLDAAGRSVLYVAADPVAVALATIARNAVELFGGPLATRLKRCEAEDCDVIFLDTSRSGRRRWCSMDRCGARAKAKAFRDRHRPQNAV